MIQAQKLPANQAPDAAGKDTTIFSIPIGKLGFFSCVLMGAASGFMAFFFTLFCAILGIMIYDTATGTSMLNLTISYRYIAAPVGVLVMLISLAYLLTLWTRRKLAGRE